MKAKTLTKTNTSKFGLSTGLEGLLVCCSVSEIMLCKDKQFKQMMEFTVERPQNNKFLQVHIFENWVWSVLKVENLACLYLKVYIQHKQLTLP